MTLEIIKTIALLCQVVAGDTNSISSTAQQVNWYQTDCQSFLSNCAETYPLSLCVSERKKRDENDVMMNTERFKDKENQVMGPFK